jgi:hypothetical protein
MLHDLMDRPMNERFDHLLHVLQSESFLSMTGMGKEVPFFICPFHPSEAVEMMRVVKQLKNQLSIHGIHVMVIDLYDLCIDIIKQGGNWELVLEFERENSKDELFDLLQGMLDPQDFLIPAIEQRIRGEQFDILFLTGVGEVYPYLRSHSLLNNLQPVVKDHPLVMFYPGKYMQKDETGTSLVLFERLKGNQYYRAFNILKYQIQPVNGE